MNDCNTPKQFQRILVHGFQEICLEICASIYQNCFNDANILKKFKVNPFYRFGEMEKTSLLQEVVLNYYRKF